MRIVDRFVGWLAWVIGVAEPSAAVGPICLDCQRRGAHGPDCKHAVALPVRKRSAAKATSRKKAAPKRKTAARRKSAPAKRPRRKS